MFDLVGSNLVKFVAVLFLISAFLPLGVFHTLEEPSTSGGLFNILLPSGWVALIAFVLLFFFEKRINSRIVLLSCSLLILGLLLVQPKKAMLSLLLGAEDIDIDFYNFILPFLIALVGIVISFIIKDKNN